MRPYNLTYYPTAADLTVSETDIDVFNDAPVLRRNLAMVPPGIVRIFKDFAVSVTAGTCSWKFLAGREELTQGEAIVVANKGQLDLNFVPDLNLAVRGGTVISLLMTTSAAFANGAFHFRVRDYGEQEFQARIANGAQIDDL